ncbi:hypothetical protein vsia_69 [Salmonella virus VSiA]|nr:hypothetical protein vsia_69 [Salmonella virus VSiA]
MTNQEYEAASIAAAGCYDRFEGEHKLKQLDEQIATLEAALVKAQEARREIVNQYNLNHKPAKCEHEFVEQFHPHGYYYHECAKCGVEK